MYLNEEQLQWCDSQQAALLDLLRTIGKIPAPSYGEAKRAAVIAEWLRSVGAQNVVIDDVNNVILKIGRCDKGPVSIVMAHTDIVFPDTDTLPMREEGGRLYAPGIGDDTANLVNLLFAAKYLIEHGVQPKEGGLLIVANVCEEGLGNLAGSKHIIEEYGSRTDKMISFDIYLDKIVSRSVGSQRYRIKICAEGGHSYSDFGNSNAIVQMSELITELYQKKVPERAKTTYNVGVIEGGTTVNSICAECTALYEYRSESRECMEEMRIFFESVIRRFKDRSVNISAELIGDRPCMGDVDPKLQQKLSDAMAGLMHSCTGTAPETGVPMSTDCNSALAVGIPSVCIGTVAGAGMHTRREWIDIHSLKTGLRLALGALIYSCENSNLRLK